MHSLPVLLMGFSSSLLQIICLRQLLTIFSGNELDIGITLAVWLTAVGTGSYAGYRFRSVHAFAGSFILIALVSQVSVLSIHLIRPALALEFGEIVPLTSTFFSTVLTIGPLCFLVGVQFPLAVSYTGNASKTYGLEAVGAFAGGVAFTLLFSGRIDAFMLSTAVSIMNLAIAFSLSGRKSLFVLFLIPPLLHIGLQQSVRVQLKGFDLRERIESRYGDITVLGMRDQSYVYASGKFQFSYPDPQTEELQAHLPITIHAAPRELLVIGGSPGLLREFLHYPVSRIDFVEIDPKIIDISMRLLSPADREAFRDKRLSFIIRDARKYVKSAAAASYDMVILNLPEPSTANINRFYTLEFFGEVKRIMKEDGVLAFSLPTSSGYIGRKMQVANGSIYASARNVFASVAVSSEEYGYIFASNSPIDITPGLLEKRFTGNSVKTQYFFPALLADAFSPLKVQMVRDRLGKASSLNSDAQPVSYLYSLMLWAEMHGGRGLNALLAVKEDRLSFVFLLLLLAVMALCGSFRKAVCFSLFTTGYAAIAFSLIIILTYQAAFGYVYEMIGLLTAFFMLGMASGAFIAKDIRRPLPWLQALELASIGLFLVSPLLFGQEVSFYALNFVCGTIAGMQFAGANLFLKGSDPAKTAGRLYAIDLSGSFSGALLTSLVLIPLLGLQKTLISLAALKGASFLILIAGRYEKT